MFSYFPRVSHSLQEVELGEQWQKLEATFRVPSSHVRACMVFHCDGVVDIDSCLCAEEGHSRLAQRKMTAILSAPAISAGFASPEDGATILSVRNASNVEFLNGIPARGLWTVRLKAKSPSLKGLSKVKGLNFDPEADYGNGARSNDCEGEDDLLIDAMQAMAKGGKTEITLLDRKEVRFIWKGIQVGDEPDALDVHVTARILPDGILRFSSEFECRSRNYTVFHFHCPQIDGLGGIHGKPQEDFLAVPLFLGRLIRNPSGGKLLRDSRFFRANSSGHSMHFDALYNQGDGLCFLVRDSQQLVKRWYMESQQGHGLLWSVLHVPDNIRCEAPQRYRVPYSVDVIPFAGD